MLETGTLVKLNFTNDFERIKKGSIGKIVAKYTKYNYYLVKFEDYDKSLYLHENDFKVLSNVSIQKTESVNNPSHYGGKDNPYEAIKVIQNWNLSFELGNVVKYISRAGKKDANKHIEDLKKAAQYLNFEIEKLEKKNV